MNKIVIDTCCVLDIFLFQDKRINEIKTKIENGEINWIATGEMREELQRVLNYKNIQKALKTKQIPAEKIIENFDKLAQITKNPPPPAKIKCQDKKDQTFIDLAIYEKATLISKDAHIYKLYKKLAQFQVNGITY